MLPKELKVAMQKLACSYDTEVAAMLLQQGLDDIIERSASEQIAHLLIERAQLIRDNELEQGRNFVLTPSGAFTAEELYRVLKMHGMDDALLGLANERTGTNTGKMPSGQLLSSEKGIGSRNPRTKKIGASSADDNVEATSGAFSAFDNEVTGSMRSQPVGGKANQMGDRANKSQVTRLKKEAFAGNENTDGESSDGEQFSTRSEANTTGREAGRDNDFTAGGDRITQTDLHSMNDGLQKSLASIESQLQQIQQGALRRGASMLARNVNKDGGKELMDEQVAEQLATVQQEFENIKAELIEMLEKYNEQYDKYMAHKMASKKKFFKAKEGFQQEKARLSQTIEKLTHELELVKATLSKELEYKETMEKRHRSLLLEQRELLDRLSEEERATKEHGRKVSTLQVRCSYLEEENDSLNKQVEKVQGQKRDLERIIQELQLEKAREPAAITVNTINTATYADSENILQDLISGSRQWETDAAGVQGNS